MTAVCFSIGDEVFVGGRKGRFTRILDFDRFMVRFDGGDTRVISRGDIDHAPQVQTHARSFDDCSSQEIEDAYRWRDALRPLLDDGAVRGQRLALVADAVKALGTSKATIYRRVGQWNADPVSLLPGKRPGGVGKSRLGDERTALLVHIVNKEYLSRKQRNVAELYKDFVEPMFAAAGLAAPSVPTVYRTIANLDPILKTERRVGKRAAVAAKAKLKGKFPFGVAPLSCVQIDYWLFDAEIVDDINRRPIGKPWLAMIIDTHTCMPCGFTLTLDDPSAAVAGAALFHAIARKEVWLRDIGYEMEWPVWGMPQILMADNAKEFRGTMLRQFLADAGTELINRPVKRPQFGAHIERFFGTLAKKVKSLPGATGSNVKERQTRDSAKTAALTLRDLEYHLLSVLHEYMNTEHSSLGGLTPLQKWRSCFFENGNQINQLPAERTDLEWLRVQLLPYKMLTLQHYGVVWDRIHYDSDELVAMRHRHARDKRKTFTVRRDPRDISKVSIWDPDNKRYLSVPYRYAEGPPMSIWELKAVRAAFKERGQQAYTELEIFDAHLERQQRHAHLEEAGKLTRKIQRQGQRTRTHAIEIARENTVIRGARKVSVNPPSQGMQVEEPPGHGFDDYDDLDI